MKKKYGLLFLLCLLMFFCINVDGVKADNLKCSADISDIKEAYACDYADYAGIDHILGQEERWDVSFTLVVVQYGDDKYCSIAAQPTFTYKDGVVFPDGFKATAGNIRDVLSFDINYQKTFNNMKNGKCSKAGVGVEAKGIMKYKGIKTYEIADEYNWIACGLGSYCIGDMKGTNLRKLDKTQLEEILKNATLTDEQVIEAIENWANKEYNFDQPINDPSKTTCKSVLTSEVAAILKNLFTILSIIGIILVIVLAMTDFIGAISSGEDDALNKAFKKVKNRIIAVIVLLLLPMIVNWIVDFANDYIYYDKDSKLKIGNLSDCFDSSSPSSGGGGTSSTMTTK